MLLSEARLQAAGHAPCRAFAEVESWNVIAVCTDEGRSGVYASRPRLLAALELVRSGLTSVTWCVDSSL
jgi:hypothetical protein